MKKHYVYKIINSLNNKIYIGKRTTSSIIEEDTYYGSGDLIKLAIKKYGLNNFTKKILKEFKTEKEAYDYEATLVTKEFILNQNTYNIALGGGTPQAPRIQVRKSIIEYQKEIKSEFKRIYFWANNKSHSGEKEAVKSFYKKIKSLKDIEDAFSQIDKTFINLIALTEKKEFEYQKINYGFNDLGELEIAKLFYVNSYKLVTQKQLKCL